MSLAFMWSVWCRNPPGLSCVPFRPNAEGNCQLNIRNNLLLQGVTASTHLDAVRTLLDIQNPDRIIISVAFMTHGGLSLVRESIARAADRTTILAGIRNGITSAQGLQLAVEMGCSIYAVDTGTRAAIFHPKIYFAYNPNEAQIIVGSANLTIGGLNSNIEASLCLAIDRSNPHGATLVDDVRGKFDEMMAEYREHVFRIPNEDLIQELLDAGRVIDESTRSQPVPSAVARNPNLDSISRMRLKPRRISHPRPEPFSIAQDGQGDDEVPFENVAESVRERWSLVWESRPLTRRDLNIPTGQNTNPTGSMLLSRGAMHDIDQRHHFRNNVFNRLAWNADAAPQRRHIERAEARFRLIIRDVDCGVFSLRLSHNTRTDTAAYEQRNSMTSLHWGADVRPYVAREDLLTRTMFLYLDDEAQDYFILEID